MKDYSDFSIEELQQMLTAHVNNTQFYRTEQYALVNSCTISEDWTGRNRRRIDFCNVVFDHAKLNQAGFTGSTFTNCVFKNNVEMNGVNFSGCNFINCSFDSVCCFAIFCKSKFVNTTFRNCTLNDCNFEEAFLDGVIFGNCQIVSANWESSNLYSVKFESCMLKRLNFEYAVFGDIHFISTAIPFQTIPFIFGGPEYILSTNDNVSIMSKIQPMTPQEYIDYMYISLEFFIKTNNWFPAVNILLALNKAEEAYKLIVQGAKEMIHLQKFRTLRHLIILSNRSSVLSYADKAHLFQELSPLMEMLESDDTIDTYDKRMYISSIRSSLLPTERGTHFLTIKTDIDQDNTQAINAMYKIVETLATDILDTPHKITISHNSPFVLDIALALSSPIISGATTILAAVLPKMLERHKEKSDVDMLKEAIVRCRPDLDASAVQRIVRSISCFEPDLNNVNIQIVQTTLPPEISNNE